METERMNRTDLIKLMAGMYYDDINTRDKMITSEEREYYQHRADVISAASGMLEDMEPENTIVPGLTIAKELLTESQAAIPEDRRGGHQRALDAIARAIALLE